AGVDGEIHIHDPRLHRSGLRLFNVEDGTCIAFDSESDVRVWFGGIVHYHRVRRLGSGEYRRSQGNRDGVWKTSARNLQGAIGGDRLSLRRRNRRPGSDLDL